jgi:hypothetical protein
MIADSFYNEAHLGITPIIPVPDTHTPSLSLRSNPTLNWLEGQLQAYVSTHSNQPLSRYINSVISTPRDEIAMAHFNLSVPSPTFSLPEGFQALSDYKGKPGVYNLVSHTGEYYVGSTMDLEGRLKGQHQPRGLNPNQTHRHPSLYKEVIKHG